MESVHKWILLLTMCVLFVFQVMWCQMQVFSMAKSWYVLCASVKHGSISCVTSVLQTRCVVGGWPRVSVCMCVCVSVRVSLGLHALLVYCCCVCVCVYVHAVISRSVERSWCCCCSSRISCWCCWRCSRCLWWQQTHCSVRFMLWLFFACRQISRSLTWAAR